MSEPIDSWPKLHFFLIDSTPAVGSGGYVLLILAVEDSRPAAPSVIRSPLLNVNDLQTLDSCSCPTVMIFITIGEDRRRIAK